MRRIGRLAVGGFVAVALIAGLTGAASADSSTTTATSVPITTAPTVTTPLSTAPPSTSSPLTTSPATTAPTAPAPSKKAKAKKDKSKKKSKTLTGAEIWAIVSGHHSINCQRAPKELKRVQAAVKAASSRLGRWQKVATAAPKTTASTASSGKAKKAKARAHRDGKRQKYFQNLQKHGNALIKRIDAKCGAKSATS